MGRHIGMAGLLSLTVLLAGALLAYAFLHAPHSSRAAQLLAATLPADDLKQAQASRGPAVEFIGYSDSLDKRTFKDAKIGGLSALSYDPRRDLYYALVDRKEGAPAQFYALRLPVESAGLGDPKVFEATTLRGAGDQPLTAGKFDGEGIAFAPWGDLVAASEVEPYIQNFSLDGSVLRELTVPLESRVVPEGQAQSNGSFEGLSMSPSGEVMFAALQKSLVTDKRLTEERHRIRLLRYQDRGTEGFLPSRQFFYATESEGGVSDIVALSDTELLVLETNNEIFYVDLGGAKDVAGSETTLADPEPEPLDKKLVASLDDCLPATSESADSPPNTFEGMALGPSLPSGGRTLMLVSDDNFDDAQTTRLAALDIRPERLSRAEHEACG